MDMKKCLDTYALVEIALGNSKFVEYFNKEFIIVNVILAEFYSWLLKKYDEKTAMYWFKQLEPYTINVGIDIFINAMNFRYAHKEKNFSFFDAVGYVYSLDNNCLFVTGDKAFEKFKGVEFRKKG